MPRPLTDAELRDALDELGGWRLVDDKLTRQFVFGSFKEALSFLVRLGLHAEELGHHPEIWNAYNRVELRLATHDAGDRVTERDLALARAINGFDWTR